jgi:hypothetical protein
MGPFEWPPQGATPGLAQTVYLSYSLLRTPLGNLREPIAHRGDGVAMLDGIAA